MVLLGAFLDKINVKSEENAMKNRVKELRDAKHLTQTGLALKVGSTQQTISKIEREIGVPKLDLALIMADFFNVTLEYLFCLSDKKHKLEHQIEIDKTIEEFYDFFVDYQDLNSENKETLNLIMRRLLEVQANEEAEQDIVNYFGMVMYNGRHKYFDSNIHFFHVLFDNQIFFGCFVYKEDN